MATTLDRDSHEALSNRRETEPEGTGKPAGLAEALRRLPGMSIVGVLLVATGCVFFLYHNYLPLFHSDLWGHVAYGDWMLTHGRLPIAEPFAPLAEGSRLVCTAWLSQVILALVGRGADPERIAHLFAGVMLSTTLVLIAACSTRIARTSKLSAQRRWIVAVGCACAAFVIAWSRHAVQRPEMFASLCCALLLWIVARVSPRAGAPRWAWFAIPLLFTAWANLHGSFVVGWLVLAGFAAGRAGEELIAAGNKLAAHVGMGKAFLFACGKIVNDRVFRDFVWLLELAILGSAINPYGVDLLLYTLWFADNPNLSAVLEWYPLDMKSLEGIPMAVSWTATAAILRWSRKRLEVSEVLLLLLFSGFVCLHVRMIAWYAPICMFVLSPHLADVCERVGQHAWFELRTPKLDWLEWRSPRATLVAGLLVWMTFACSPVSRPLLGGTPRRADQIFSHDTPLGATAYFQKHPPAGMVAAPQWWGDWFVWRGPTGMQVMLTTNAVHLTPPQVWNDYLSIATAETGLETRLNRYRINTVVVSKKLQPRLQRQMESLTGWTVVFEDANSLIAVRKPTRAE